MSRKQDRFAPDFAIYAGTRGWTEDSLRQFCADHGISGDERRKRWPAGVRSVGWELNDFADKNMLDLFVGASQPSMGEIIASRFAQNRDIRPAVARLALSDLWHPIDTLARTRRTARLMWRCYGRSRWSHRLGKVLDCWLLVLVYSVCVSIWLLDKSARAVVTRCTVRGSLLMIGLR